jgi:hypothetical protein
MSWAALLKHELEMTGLGYVWTQSVRNEANLRQSCNNRDVHNMFNSMNRNRNYYFFPLALQPTFGPWHTSMKLFVSLQFPRSWTFGRTPWMGDQLVARPLPVHKHRKTHIHKH